MGSIQQNSLSSLPNEVIQQVLQYLHPKSIPSFQRTCKRFNALADAIVWREKCRAVYRYWRPEHNIAAKFAGNVHAVDWRALFIERELVDQGTTEALNDLLSSQTGRLEKAQRILEHGYDAKDCLLRHCAVGDEADDVLARRLVGPMGHADTC